MAYTALYRKYRPPTFDDVKGQDHIVRTLKNQIQSDRVGHAYLFCGTRGTGKTSIAKIFARAVNCENPVDGSPCNTCKTCRAILDGASMNVMEIDAASNNGVDNVREIRDEVQYSPTDGKYRVYIIDEVHMLSTGAFNALLKTLEEPPAYVIFILATTEAHRIPITVLSRCQRYDLKRINSDIIAGQIRQILDQEGIEAQEKAIRYIAKAADGSMRDAQSLLEQCISFYYGQRLDYEKVLDVLGAVDNAVFSQLLREVINQDVAACISVIDEIVETGRELTQFVTDFTWYMRNLLLVQTSDQEAEALEMSTENYAALKEEASLLDIDTLMRYIRIFSELSNQLRYAVSKRVLVEMAVIKMMKPAMEHDTDSMMQRLQKLEDALAGGMVIAGEAGQAVKTTAVVPDEDAPNAPVVELSEAEYKDYKQIHEEWGAIIRSQSRLISSLLKGTKLSYDKQKGLIVLFTDSFHHATMAQGSRMNELCSSINERYGKNFQITAQLLNAGEVAPRIVGEKKIAGIEMEIGIEE